MPATDSSALANELMTSWTTGETISTPPSSRGTDFTMDMAYAVEAELRRLRIEAGRAVTGRKVGYANKAMWRALKLETLVWASMYDDTVRYASLSNEISLKHFITAKVEPEIVFKLKQTMPRGDLDAAGALECVEWLAMGFEIIDCPFPGWQFKPADFVAAFGLHRALVVGQPRYVDSAEIPTLVNELPGFKLRLFRNGELAEEGSGRNSLRSPALCLVELASAVVRQPGAAPLEAGEIISTGTLTGPQPIASGEQWKVEIEGLPVPDLQVSFA